MEQNNETIQKLKYLGLSYLCENWDQIHKTALKKNISFHRFLSEIIDTEYALKKQHAKQNRIKSAKIPIPYILDTFPFANQPKLKKKVVLELYDSLGYINHYQFLIFIGPTGCGKTGLATSFLIHAINNGCSGLFITLDEMIRSLHSSRADLLENKIIKKFKSYDILLIDELGYSVPGKDELAMFFEIMKDRAGRNCTIITSQLGFDEWIKPFQDQHLTAAFLDRITTDCVVFNMKSCISIRPKKIISATSDK